MTKAPPSSDTAPSQPSSSLHTQIVAALVLGAVAAAFARWLCASAFGIDAATFELFTTRWITPFGDVFVKGMLVGVVPLVFCSIILGVYRLGDLPTLGRLGATTMVVFAITSLAGAMIATLLAYGLRPGDWVSAETRADLARQFAGAVEKATADAAGSKDKLDASAMQFVSNLIPDNLMTAASSNRRLLEIIAAALVLGVAMVQVPADKVRALAEVLEGITETLTSLIGIVMRLAPVGVFALVFTVVAKFGASVLASLAVYTAVALLALALHVVLVLLPLASVAGGVAPGRFLHAIREIALAAFSTSSSNATLPTSLRVVEQELGVPKPIASFVLPLGATVNMDGTTIYQIVAVHFVGQVYGVPMSVSAMFSLIFVCMTTAVGAAGVPGGVIPLLYVGMSAAGIPDTVIPQAIALVLGVDRLLDMCRTTVNVLGDATTATVVARREAIRLGHAH